MSLGKLLVVIGAKTSEFEQAMRNVNKQMRSAERDFKGLAQMGRRLESAGKKMAIGITLPFAAAGGAALKFAMDAVESENLFEVSMGNMATASREWSDQLSDALGLNEYELRRNVGTFNVMLDSMGMGEQASYDMAKGLTQLSYDMSSFYNLKPEEAFQKLQSGISGEIEPLKRLGIIVNDTTIKAYAYQNGIAKVGEELSEQQKVLARYGVIMDATSKAQGDMARTAESPANKLRVLTERAKELAVDLGTVLIPMFEKSVTVASKVVTWFSNLSEGQKKTIITVGMLVAAIGPALLILSQMARAVIALSAAKKVLAVSTIGQKLIPAISKLGKALTFLTANPVGIAIMAIAGLAAVGIYVYKNWDTLKVKLLAIWDVIAAGAENAGIKIGTTWNVVKLAVYKSVGGMLDAVAPLLKWLPGAVTRGFETMRIGIKTKVADAEANLQSLSERAENNEERMRAALEGVGAAFERTGGTVTDETAGMAYQSTGDITAMGTGLQGLQKKMKDTGDAAKNLRQEAEKALADATRTLDNFGRQALDALRARYQEEERIQVEALDKELDNQRRATAEKLKMYDEEYNAKLKLLDEESAAAVAAVQGQIDGINAQTDAEEKALREQEHQKQVAELQKRLDEAETAEEREKIQEDLAKVLASRERELLLESRRQQIEALREQIEAIRAQAEEKRAALKQDYEDKKKAEEDMLKATTDRLEEETKALKKHYEELTREEALQAEIREKMIEGQQDEIIALLDGYNKNWRDQGQSFGESLIEGLNSTKGTVEAAVADMLALVGRAQAAAAKLANTATTLVGQTHTVETGDTLGAIAAKYGTTVDSLARTNNIQNVNLIRPGQEIKIPGLAGGGRVVGAGLALVGEKGPELASFNAGAQVTPLPTNPAAPTSQTIIIQLDSRILAQKTIQHMPTILRMQGVPL